MQTTFFDPAAPKKSTNLSINHELLKLARESRINLSQALEQHLADLLREDQRRKWLEENRKAIDDYNSRVGNHGVFNDGLRQF